MMAIMPIHMSAKKYNRNIGLPNMISLFANAWYKVGVQSNRAEAGLLKQ